MLSVDLHVHSLFSRCGLHTVLELLAMARERKMDAIAITDHGPAMGSRLTSVFFERFRPINSNVTMFKGLECNITDADGGIDLPVPYITFIDIVLLGIHGNIKQGKSKDYYTTLMIKAMSRNPMVDIITHPNDPLYPIDYLTLAHAAAEYGVALELNNSKILYKRSNESEAEALLYACKEAGCLIAVNSDTHAIHELGDDSAVAPIIKRCDFPRERIVNRDIAAASLFLDKRKQFKR